STYYLTYDQVGSLRIVADASGNVIKKIDYDSFGNIINDSDPTFEIPFGFAGGLHDRDTGLVRFGYRDYDPDVGRWTAKDPILFAGGDTDLYGYCLNDPVNEIDPFGLDSYHVPGTPYIFGSNRPGSIVKPGDAVSVYLSDNMRFMDQTAIFHDPLVGFLMDIGLPFDLVNYPTMIQSYAAACIYNNLTDYDNKSEYFIILEIRFK
ncbi:MAG: RHS repeat-associated core domain-containing protein, partial [Thermodesulfobacteriota bacterium]|nr:RHS repeat-associated core domain-containing protein [Thermodesulfobacteriota bacterium]